MKEGNDGGDVFVNHACWKLYRQCRHWVSSVCMKCQGLAMALMYQRSAGRALLGSVPLPHA